MPKAFITGITGQDGSYLAELLLAKGYEVHGLMRRSSSFNTGRIDHIFDRLKLYHGDILDSSRLDDLIRQIQPDELYNLAAQSHVKVSFEEPVYSAEVAAMGALRVFEAVRRFSPETKVYQASSSEMYGFHAPPQGILTPFAPVSPYACAKLFAHNLALSYRTGYGLNFVSGILFNHEGPRRSETFVTRKITRAATRIKLGLQKELVLGNLNAKRDWGFAGDYVEAMWLGLQAVESASSFVVATGEAYSVQDFVERVFACLDLDWRQHVKIDPRYFRPNEVSHLCGVPDELWSSWRPKTSFDSLVEMMVSSDYALAKKEASK